MFFQPQTHRLVVGMRRKKEGTMIFQEAQTTLLFVYARQECKAISWKPTSANLVGTNCKVNPHWWSIEGGGSLKDDLPQDDMPAYPIYFPTLTFHGGKFSDLLTKQGGRDPAERNLYQALLGAGKVHLNVQVNGEAIVPLVIELEYRTMRS